MELNTLTSNQTQLMFTDKPAIGPVKKSSLSSRSLWLLSLLGGLFVVGLIFLVILLSYRSAVYSPSEPSGEAVSVVIPEGASTQEIRDILVDAQVLQHPHYFDWFLRLSNSAHLLQAGSFSIPKTISVEDLVASLGRAETESTSLTFLEGWRREEYVDYLASSDASASINADMFSELALEPSSDLRDILGNSLPEDASLQGFLFPDTYMIDKDTKAESLISQMLLNYQAKVTQQMRSGWSTQKITEYEAVNLAAIIEREGRSDEEKRVIAGILLKRLSIDEPLGVDATLQYALGYSDSEKRWWRQGITVQDLALISPYNTRKVAGLPPRPICNPGLSALKAVADPVKTDYLYYLHDAEGRIHYAKTLSEHNANIAKYL